jgi:hypothetical protein
MMHGVRHTKNDDDDDDDVVVVVLVKISEGFLEGP